MTNRQIIDMLMAHAREAHAKGVRLEDELQKRESGGAGQ